MSRIDVHGIFRIVDGTEMGINDDESHDDDRSPHDSQFRTDEGRNDEFRYSQAQGREQGNHENAFEGFQRAADNGDDDERANNIERQELQANIRRQLDRVEARQVSQGAGRDTDGTIRCRNGVSNQADQDSLDGVEAQGNQHRRRDSDSRTEAGHAFHEGAETPADEQGQDAAVLADRRQHVLDDIHALGVQGQIIRKDSGDDDQ